MKNTAILKALLGSSALSLALVQAAHGADFNIPSGDLRTALDAFATGVRPDVVHFKSVYLFAREEGYPLKQHWFPTLPAEDRATVAVLLNRPLAEQTAAPAAVQRLERRLAEYLRGHTEILVE